MLAAANHRAVLRFLVPSFAAGGGVFDPILNISPFYAPTFKVSQLTPEENSPRASKESGGRRHRRGERAGGRTKQALGRQGASWVHPRVSYADMGVWGITTDYPARVNPV